MDVPDRHLCLTLHPSVKEFSRPFCEYIKDVCREHPGVPMFKVVSPAGWRPDPSGIDRTSHTVIETPIKQNVVGSGGAFKCVLEEYRKLTVADMKRLATSDKYKPPPTGRSKDDWLEREFWSSVSINPPIYGADTPESFFDKKLPYGWNLQNLGDLLCECDVPAIPGVTSPMVYFGMWKSFFSWHVEDVDLYSINYLHFGAPKVWYCIPPGKERDRFERLAQSIFPHDADKCPAFLRHKEFLISPKTLRSHGIKFVQAKQEAGEFIVLNAGAYHCGYNLGFNCAEAVNFATQDWLELGETASTCTCRALSDPVTLDMTLFRRASKRLKAARGNAKETETPSPRESQPGRPSSSSESDREDSESRMNSGSEASSSSTLQNSDLENLEEEESTSSASSQRESDHKQSVQFKRSRGANSPPRKMKNLNDLSARTPLSKNLSTSLKVNAARGCSQGQLKQTLLKNVLVKAEKKPDPARKSVPEATTPHQILKAFRPSSSHALAKLKAARGQGSKRLAGQRAPEIEESPRKKKKIATLQGQDLHQAHHMNDSEKTPVQRAMQWMKSFIPQQPELSGSVLESESSGSEEDDDVGLPESACYAIVGEDEKTHRKFFHLVQKLKRKVASQEHVFVRWLRPDSDGIYRPTTETWKEAKSALVPVRSQQWSYEKDKPPGIRLLTLKYRILETDFVD